MFKSFKVSYVLYMFTYMTVLQAQNPYDIESGMVLYDIRGGTQLTLETNLSIKGQAKLHFKEWGEVKIEEENGVVLTTGAIKHKQNVKRFEKQTKDKIITADYKNEQILERTRHKNKSNFIDVTEGLLKTSQETVAGVLCDVWEGLGVKKCIYKGIVLKLESHILDVSYVRVATKAMFDINLSDENCEVPDYPVHEFGLFNDSIKTKNTNKAENVCKILKNVAYDLKEFNTTIRKNNLESKERKKFINSISQDIYEKQKEILPKLLVSMKKTRECLQTGDNPFEANQCMEHFSRMKEKLGTDEEDFILLWNDKRKNELLDKIEDELIYLQSRIPCVKRAKNITDLSKCMK